MKHQIALPNSSVGLDSASIGESNFDEQVYRYIAEKHAKRALMGDTLKQASVPKGTVAPADKLRKSILQLSLFPDIYTKVKKVHHPGNVDFGDMD
jgi:hypothetical protein